MTLSLSRLLFLTGAGLLFKFMEKKEQAKPGEQLLERIVEAIVEPPPQNLRIFSQDELTFSDESHERLFRQALSKVACKKEIRKRGATYYQFVRPNNLLELGKEVNAVGLEHCQTAKSILRFLDIYKRGTIQFITDISEPTSRPKVRKARANYLGAED